MKINRIQNNNIKFKGQIIENDALKKLKTRLNSAQVDAVEKYINDIKKIKDDKTFVYDSLTVGKRVISKIHITDRQGNLIKLPLFIEFGENPVKVFEQMANWYKHVIKI